MIESNYHSLKADSNRRPSPYEGAALPLRHSAKVDRIGNDPISSGLQPDANPSQLPIHRHDVGWNSSEHVLSAHGCSDRDAGFHKKGAPSTFSPEALSLYINLQHSRDKDSIPNKPIYLHKLVISDLILNPYHFFHVCFLQIIVKPTPRLERGKTAYKAAVIPFHQASRERNMGIEPISNAWKALMLPLHQSRI